MNIIDIQDNLKNLPEQALMQEMQMPTGSAPQFLVLGELKRRKQMREDYKRQQNADMKTVAEEVVTAAGAPQEGIMQMARSLNPNTNMAQDTGLAQATPVTPTQAPQPQAPQMMSDGGIMRMARGGRFGTDIEYNYKTFLQENNLNDTPYAQDMFARLKETMDNKYATEGPNNNPRIYDNAIGFERSPEGLASVSSDASDFMPDRAYSSQFKSRYDNPYYSLGKPLIYGMRTMGYGDTRSIGPQRPEGTDAAFTRQTSPAEPMSTLDQLRSSVYSNNPLENALAGTGLDSNVIGTSVIDPIMNRIDEAVSREGMPSQTAADLANEMALRNREMASENAGRLTAEELLAVSPESSSELLSGSSIAEAAPTTMQDIINARSVADNQGGPMGEAAAALASSTTNKPESVIAAVAPEPLSYDDLVAKAQAGSPVTESDLVASVEAGLLNDNQAADINAMLDDSNYIPSAQEQRISNLERTNRMPPSGPTNPDLLGPRVFRGIGDYAAGVFGDRTIGEQDAIDAERAEETAAFAQANALEVPVGSMVEQETTTVQGDANRRAADSMFGTGITSIGGQGGTTSVAAQDTGTTTGTTPATTTTTTPAGFGSMDSRIAQMLSNRQKEAESDKWMALAQTGMALMASKNPTFGGALGEAGLAGIGALQKSKQGAQAFETDMLKLQTQLDIAQQRARSSGSSKNIPATALNSAQADVESAQTRLLEARTDAERLSASRALKIAQGRYNQLTRMFDTQHGVPIANANGVGGTKNINLTST